MHFLEMVSFVAVTWGNYFCRLSRVELMIKLLKIVAARPEFNELMRNKINNGIVEADTHSIWQTCQVFCLPTWWIIFDVVSPLSTWFPSYAVNSVSKKLKNWRPQPSDNIKNYNQQRSSLDVFNMDLYMMGQHDIYTISSYLNPCQCHVLWLKLYLNFCIFYNFLYISFLLGWVCLCLVLGLGTCHRRNTSWSCYHKFYFV